MLGLGDVVVVVSPVKSNEGGLTDGSPLYVKPPGDGFLFLKYKKIATDKRRAVAANVALEFILLE